MTLVGDGEGCWNYSSSSGAKTGCDNVTGAIWCCTTKTFSIVFGVDNVSGVVSLPEQNCSPFIAGPKEMGLTFSSDPTCCDGTISVTITG